MRLWLSAFALILLAGALRAEVAGVRGGEHPDFTRLVVSAAAAGDWRFGRTAGGYELQMGQAVTGFDLAQAFDRIPRDRLSGLWRDPASGRLQLALSCACHALAFEFRPGTIVIDIKPGPAPAGSGFELSLDAEGTLPAIGGGGENAPADPPTGTPPENVVAADGGYDWIGLVRAPDRGPRAADGAPPLPLDTSLPALDPLRDALLAQISRGVAEGIIDIDQNPALPKPAGVRRAEEAGIRIVTGDLPGMIADRVNQPGPNLSADGSPCLKEADLDVTSWLLPGPVAEQMGPGRAGLLGEFDAPAPEAILRAARLYIALGFGAEARQFLDLLPGEAPQETTVLRALAHVTDQEPGGEAVFAPMAACDGAASLWSALTLTAAGSAPDSAVLSLNATAVARAFSQLPAHLRLHFGPPLVDLFLRADQNETARLIRDAILRATPPDSADQPPGVALMEANFGLATGDPDRALRIAQVVAGGDGQTGSGTGGQSGARGLITLVEAAFRSGAQLPPDAVARLAAYQTEATGTPLAAPLARAVVLAAALQGDFARAFAEAPAAPDTLADLWSVAATGSDDDTFLAEAVPAADGPPPTRPETALAVARRLLALGFPMQSREWLGKTGPGSDAETLRLAATAALAQTDASGVLQLISGLDDDLSDGLRASALLQLGDPKTAAALLDRAGDTAARDRAMIWTQDWAALAKAGPEPWRKAAALVEIGSPTASAEAAEAIPGELPDGTTEAAPEASPNPVAAGPRPSAQPFAGQDDGPLAQGAVLIADSVAARAAIDAMLAAANPPLAP